MEEVVGIGLPVIIILIALIVGFSHTHLSGTGIGDLCDIQFMPAIFSKSLTDDEIVKQKFVSKFNHKNEKANPGYYSVLLKDFEITAELTPSLRSGLQRYTFENDGDRIHSTGFRIF